MLTRRSHAAVCVLSSFLLACHAGSALPAAEAPKEAVSRDAPAKPASFHTDVVPILRKHCQGCHQPAKAKGKLDVTTYATLLKGGRSADPAIVKGQPEGSLLVEKITPVDGEADMPKDRDPLSPPEIEVIRRWIAEGAEDDTPAESEPLYTQEHPPAYEHPPVVTALAYSPDGAFLAVSGRHEVLLYKPDGSGVLHRLVGQARRIESLAFSPDGKRLAAAGGIPQQKGEIQIWDAAERKLILSVAVTHDTLYGASWSPDGNLLAFGCGDNTLRVIEAATGKEVLLQGAHNDFVLDTVFSVDGTHLVSVSRDHSMKLTQVQTGQFIDNITSITPGALKGGLIAVDRHPLRDELLTAGADGEPRIYQMHRTEARKIGDDANLVRKFEALPGRLFAAAYSPDGSRIAVASSQDGTGEARVYQADDGKLILKVKTPETALYALAFQPDGMTLAAGGFDGLIRIIDAACGEIRACFPSVPLDRPAAAAAAVALDFSAPPEVLEAEAPLEGFQLERIEAVPAKVELTHAFDYAQVLITGIGANGDRVDLTRAAARTACGAVCVSPRGLVRPVKNGSGEVKISVADRSATLAVVVRGLDEPKEPSFVEDVMPVISKLGCTSGLCHGSAKGKGALKTSMRGNDPLFDHRALTDDLRGRRFDRVRPEESLFLEKLSGAVPHEGGVLSRPGEPYYEILKAWVAAGAKLDLTRPRPARLEIRPANLDVPAPGMRQQIAVLAAYADGRVRDVTAEAFIETSNLEVTRVDKQGVVTALRRGEAAILARYEGCYAAATMFVRGDRSGFAWQDVPEYNTIDALVYEKLRRVKTLPAELSTDAEFLRRIYLDLTGLPPRPRDVRLFLADSRDPRVKREEVIDRLIGGAEFIEHWTNKWADLLQVNQKYLSAEGAAALRGWIRSQVASNAPYDRFAGEILTACGSTLKNPPAAYFKVNRAPDLAMETTTQLFLGIRFSCNKCHDHPFERWTQSHHWELAAYFARVGRKNAEGAPIMPRKGENQPDDLPIAIEEIIAEEPEGEVKSPLSGLVVQPRFPFELPGDRPAAAGSSRRQDLAAWLTSPENPYFARSFVNRIWSYLLGVGIIEPVDDIRAGNPPTNPALLDYLTEEFRSHGFDVRHLLRTICLSRVYQHSSKTNRWNEDDEINYSHALPRRLPAEVLYDAIELATGWTAEIPGFLSGTRAAELPGPEVKLGDGFLDLFGRPPRESPCECDRSGSTSLGQALNLVNGATIAEALEHPRGTLAGIVRVKDRPEDVLEELFLAFLGRLPAAAELEKLAVRLDPGDRLNADSLSSADGADLEKRFAGWVNSQRVISWTALRPAVVKSAGGAALAVAEDGSILASGESPAKDTYTVVAWTELEGITGLRLEALPHESLKKKGPGRSENGNFVLSEVGVAAVAGDGPAPGAGVALENPSASYSQDGWPVAAAIDGNRETGWAVMPRSGAEHRAIFEFKEKLGGPGGTTLVIKLDQQHGARHTLGRFRLSITTAERPLGESKLPPSITGILAIDPAQRSPEQEAALFRYYISKDPEMSLRLRLSCAKDIAWALINTPEFLFNR